MVSKTETDEEPIQERSVSVVQLFLYTSMIPLPLRRVSRCSR